MRRIFLALGAAAVSAVAALAALATVALQADAPPGRDHVVEIRDFAFTPEELVVAPGDTVLWINKDIVPHAATAKDGSWDSAAIEADGAWRMVVREGMPESYFCAYHPSMTARLRIETR